MMMRRRYRLLAGLVLTANLATAVAAEYRAELSTGWGDDDTQLYRVGVARDWNRAWYTDGDWQLTGYWLAQIGYWNSDKDNRQNDKLWEVGLTPVLRLAPKASGGMRPYLEAGLGGHVLSDTRIGNRNLSTAWQFGSHLGAGLDCGRLRIGYRFQHLSNASIKEPNDGIDFHVLTADMRF
jgi:hypothetical protein